MDIPEFLRLVWANQSAMERARQLYRDRLAPDFNPFDFIEPDEMMLSKVIAWFLDPAQTHGQGGRFLRLFLEELGATWPPEACEQAEARTEATVPGGRLDILVKSGKRILAIENKPWAGDQANQICRYLAYLDQLALSDYHLAYLTTAGSEPSAESINEEQRLQRISAGQLHLWGYRKEVLAWLSKCRAECRADRVTAFIEEFSHYIRKAFEGVKDRTMSDHLLDEIAGSAEKVSAAMQVIMLADPIRKRLLSDLQQQIVAKIPGFSVEISDDPWEKYSGITISFSDQSPYGFGMEFQNTQYNGLYIGVFRKEKDSPERANEYSSLVTNIGHAPQTPSWLWGRYASPTDSLLPVARDWYATAEPWIEIANGKLACRIAEAFTRVHGVLNECAVG